MPRIARHASPGLICDDHVIAVPVDHAVSDGPTLEVFARVVTAAGKEDEDLPLLLYLQGGPGGKADRPLPSSAWLRRALEEFRVVLMDQRGTGRSTPATRQTLDGLTPAEQADYLAHFRADSIVADAELVRADLIGDRRWSVLGQSFGGFCAVSYLSFAPEGLREVLITGGLPGVGVPAEAVYRAAYPRVHAKNRRYFARYPQDQQVLTRVLEHLGTRDVRMPTGERLSPRRLQVLGLLLGSQTGFERLHHLFEEAFVSGRSGPQLSDTFLRGVDAAVSFTERPLFAVLHEAIYAEADATSWAAHRVRQEFPEFDPAVSAPLLTGEMIYPWMFEEDPGLEALAPVADLLARRTGWPRLYDAERLAANDVPVAAVVYHDDMYVDRDHSLTTADLIGRTRVWVTNEYEHDGLRTDERVLDRLLALVRGRTG